MDLGRRVAERYTRRFLAREGQYFVEGDIVLYGKYKNHRGKIVAFGKDKWGNPTVEVEPIPKGRKQNKVFGLFKIWRADVKEKALAEQAKDLTARVRDRFLGRTGLPASGAPIDGGLLSRVTERYLEAALFDFPGNLYTEIVDWANDQIDKLDLKKPWKKFEKKFTLSADLFEDWRYLDRMKQFPEAFNASIRALSPLHVVFKNDSKKSGLGAGGSWTPAGNKLIVNTYQIPNGAEWSSTVKHELRHFTQYFMGRVLREAGISAKPGQPSPSMSDNVRQRSKGKIVDRLDSHALDDSEFYTKLGSEIDFWLDLEDDEEEYKELPQEVKMAAARWYAGVDRPRPRVPIPSWLQRRLAPEMLTSIFGPLQRNNPDKWKKAVKEFFKQVP
jgi:hypothetical protein